MSKCLSAWMKSLLLIQMEASNQKHSNEHLKKSHPLVLSLAVMWATPLYSITHIYKKKKNLRHV